MTSLSVEATPMSRKQIRSFARQVRMALGLENTLHVDIGTLLEHLMPKAMRGFIYDIRETLDMGSDHGRARPDDRVIELREDVYNGAIDGEGRDRMTVVHEIGHLLMHQSDRITHRRSFGPPIVYMDAEWQAKAFAGEFLIPVHLVQKFDSALKVAKACGVSIEAARMQLKQYTKEGLIEKGQIKDLAL
jgi:Zn-dependent peptidase ImmA (M78 family)